MLKRNNFREICVYLQQKQLNNDDYGNDNRKKTQCSPHELLLELGEGHG